MAQGRRFIIATRRSDLAWALHHEVTRQPGWSLIATVDPRSFKGVILEKLQADIVLVEASDLIWLWDHKLAETSAMLSKLLAVVVLSDREMLDVVVRVKADCGLLLRAEYDALPVDLLDLAIRGYMSISPEMLHRLAGDQLRLDIVGDLSREELAILSYVGATLSNRQIAAASGLPESRVKTLVRLVMRKLRLQNRTGVAVFATANRLVAQAAVPTLAKKSVLQCAISDESEAEEFKP